MQGMYICDGIEIEGCHPDNRLPTFTTLLYRSRLHLKIYMLASRLLSAVVSKRFNSNIITRAYFKSFYAYKY
jgi:hypothetical protein